MVGIRSVQAPKGKLSIGEVAKSLLLNQDITLNFTDLYRPLFPEWPIVGPLPSYVLGNDNSKVIGQMIFKDAVHYRL